MDTKIITFWTPYKRTGNSTNTALYTSYIHQKLNDMEKAVVLSINTNKDSIDYITSNNIKEGLQNLLFLQQNNQLNSEDVLTNTYTLTDKIDILGTNKILFNNELLDKAIKILSLTYDYIIVDAVSEENKMLQLLIKYSDVVILNLPQDKYLVENIDINNLLEGKKYIPLISKYDDKAYFKIEDLEISLNKKLFKITENSLINEACFNQNVLQFVKLNIKNTLKSELEKLYVEINRLLNTTDMDISCILKNKKNNIKNTGNIRVKDNEVKIVKEYKFLKAKNNIGIINLSEQAGSTFLTMNISALLSHKKLDVSVVEIPTRDDKHDIYHHLNLNNFEYDKDKYLQKYIYDNIPLENINLNESYVEYQKIKYFINHEGVNLDNWSEENNINFLNIINRFSSINLYDIGNKLGDKNVDYLLNFLDCCVVVVDPLPYKLLQSQKRFNLIKTLLNSKGVDVVYVINKYLDDIKIKYIEDYLDISNTCNIPFVKPEVLYNAAYSLKTAYDLETNVLFRTSLNKIIDKANIAVNLKPVKSKRLKLNFFKRKVKG